MRWRIGVLASSVSGIASDGERITARRRSCQQDSPSEVESMRSILAFFLTLSVSIGLATSQEAGALPENQLSPDDNKDREILRLASLLNSGEAEVRLDTVLRLSLFRSPAA